MADAGVGAFSDDFDDLPRTVRREKEARAREARERAAQERGPSLSAGPDDYGRPQPRIYRSIDDDLRVREAPVPATVRAFDVPFMKLVFFSLKAVIAAIPALFVLGAILWFAGAGLELLFPQLIKMKILIGFSN
jgi:hypothetical protein